MRRLVLAVIAAAAPAQARAEDARLVTARDAYVEQEQERTIAILVPMLAAPGVPEHERAMALRLAGCAHMVLGHRDAAVAAFRQAFALEPDAALEPQLASPDARSLFEVARGEWRAALVTEMADHAAELAQLHLRVGAPPRGRGGAPLAIGVRVDDPGKLVARVELAYRRRGDGAFTVVTERPANYLTFAIPGDAIESAKPFVLEYHVTARHRSGFDLRRDGDPDHPHALPIDAGHRARWYESWWVRGAFAFGVVGVGAGAYFLYRTIDVGPQDVVVR